MSDIVSHKIHKALKLRIYPSEEQRVILNKTFGCCRVVYNERIAEHINYSDTYKDSPDKPKFKGTLPKELREKKYPWLGEDTISEALIQSQRNCEQAYSNFFKSLKILARLCINKGIHLFLWLCRFSFCSWVNVNC